MWLADLPASNPIRSQVWCFMAGTISTLAHTAARPTRTDIEQRLADTKRAREHWKGNRDYVKLLDIDVWALEIALEHLTRLEHPERGDES